MLLVFFFFCFCFFVGGGGRVGIKVVKEKNMLGSLHKLSYGLWHGVGFYTEKRGRWYADYMFFFTDLIF